MFIHQKLIYIICLTSSVKRWYLHHAWAVNSAGECHLDVVEVIGSNPIPPILKKPSDVKSWKALFFIVAVEI